MVIRKIVSSARWLFSFAFLSTSLVTTAFANDTVATASVNRTNVAKDEVFQLKVAVNKQVSNSAVDFSVLQPDFFMGRPSFGSYSNSVNGVKTVSSEWTIALAASRTGIIKIPSFIIGDAQTTPIAIQVSNDNNARTQEDIIQLAADVEKKDLYEGERTTLHARLIIKADLRRLQNTNIGAAFGEGLIIEPIGKSNQYQSVIDGVEATIIDQSFHITPEYSGTLTLHPPRVKGALVDATRTRNGGTRLIQLDKSAPAITLHVKAKPSHYQGVWLPTPSLSIDQLWQDEDGNRIQTESAETKVGAPIQRTLVIRATNLNQQQMPNIKVDYPDQVRVYSEPPQFNQGENGELIMTVKQVLIAKEAGQFEFPPVSVRWWNSELGQEQTSTASGLSVDIEEAEISELVPVVQPTLPQQTITVTNSGFWPYLTGLFALLWVATLAILWKEKRKPLTEKTTLSNIDSNDLTTQLIRSIQNKDGIAFDRIFREWSHTVELDDSVIGQANTFRQSLYGKDNTSIDDQAFIKTLKEINKRKETSSLNSLAPL